MQRTEDNMKDKKKSLIKELLRYCVAGGSAFVLDLITKTLFNSHILPENMGLISIFGFDFELRVTLATIAGFIVGLIVNYVISIVFVFTSDSQKERGRGVKAFMVYFAVSVVGLLVNLGVTHLGCNLLSVGRDDTVAFMFVSCVAAGMALIWNYIGRKIFVYKGE